MTQRRNKGRKANNGFLLCVSLGEKLIEVIRQRKKRGERGTVERGSSHQTHPHDPMCVYMSTYTHRLSQTQSYLCVHEHIHTNTHSLKHNPMCVYTSTHTHTYSRVFTFSFLLDQSHHSPKEE